MTPELRRLAEALLAAFRGREDHAAKGNPDGSFGPVKLPGPMRPEWLAKHLAGEVCAGFYLMTPESRVWCSCADFDNKPDAPDVEWRYKAERLSLWLQQAGLCPLVEVSQSGHAAHVWLFFDEPADAWVVRAFWDLASHKSGVPVREVYPRQDALTGKGLGNLVRYPLWRESYFPDAEDEWKPVEPLEALAAVRRTNAAELRTLAGALGAELKPRPVVAAVAGPTPISAELPEAVRARLARPGTLLRRRWEGDLTGLKDQSRSALVLSIACELVRQWFLDAEVAAAVRFWCQENGYEKGERDDWINLAVLKAHRLMQTRQEERSSNSLLLKAACHQYLDTLANGRPLHVRSGLEELDRSIDGAAPGEMVVIAGRPGHGKSALALQWLDCASRQGFAGLILSEEMSALQLGRRQVQRVASLSGEDWCREAVPILRADVERHFVGRADVHVVESATTVERAEDLIDQYCGQHGVRVVAVDYVQLLRSRAATRYEAVTDVSSRLKQAAARHQAALLAVCQPNREVEKRPGHEPNMADLRDSGQLEQDADLIVFVEWRHRYDPTLPENEYRLYVKKRRNGPVRQAVVNTTFDPERQQIGPRTARGRTAGEDEED